VSPQIVTLIDETDIWWKIETWLGEKYLYKNEGKKIAYLTFDDGPSIYTADLLKLLNEYNAKASFFMLQSNMYYQPNLVKQVVNEGHFAGFHGVSHDKDKLYNGSPYNPVLEMEKSRQTFKKITNQDHYLVRMPYGSSPFMTADFRNALVEYNYKMWDWTIDSYDWKYDDDSYGNILLNLKYQLSNVEKSGKNVVILLHERSQTLKALPSIISFLHEKGYQLKAYNPDDHIVVNFWNDKRL
jgi:peptidoglycan/xylan/chitin deacetylase (PgdA/CDA1 family)